MTKNKKEILNLIQASSKHLTAEEIYFEIKKINPTISLSTTYRNLSLLVEENLIRKHDVGKNRFVYDKRIIDHIHAIDDDGNIIDIIDDRIKEKLSEYVNGDILSYELVIHYKKR